MQQQQSKTVEHWAANVFGDILSKGQLDIIKNLWHLVVKANAAVPLVFLHFRTGTRFISGATLLFGWIVMSICWMGEQAMRADEVLSTGELPEGSSSMTLFWFLMVTFFIVGFYRRYESIKNLRRMDGKGKPRYSYDSGLSHLWMPFKFLLEPVGLIASNKDQPLWWQWNEYKFQKYAEPVLIITIGLIIKTIGYSVLGSYTVICGFCCFMLVAHREDNYFTMKQDSWDAEVLSGVVQHRDEPVERYEGAVIQQAIIRSDDHVNERIIAAQVASPFEVSEPAFHQQQA